MTAPRLRDRRLWRVEPEDWQPRLPVLVATGFVLGASLAMRGREPIEVLLVGAFSSVLAALVWIDLERRVIPNRNVYPAVALALAVSGLWPDRGPAEALAGGLCAFVPWAVISRVSRGGLGGGDVKMATLAGTVVGYPDVISAALVTAIAGGVITMALVAARRVDWTGTVPYSPFIALGAVGVLLF